ncbi:MAG: hypothetical protein JO062_21395 [Bryobacterales bacterium]|nr:hypothetical protein [Bryobacterales bacterium]
MVLSSSGLVSRLGCALLLVSGAPLFSQDSPAGGPDEPAIPAAIRPAQAPQEPAPGDEVAPDKRVFGVLPNYRTADDNTPFSPITPKQKFMIATKDTVDYPLFLLGGGFAGLAQLMNQHSDFGQGFKGYLHRYGTAYGDQFTGNYMTEGLLPILFHEDPRYFRIGPSRGGVWYRTGYAASRIFVAKTDSGRNTFNFSEVLGNSISAGIGNAYYPGERKLSDNLDRLLTALATDAVSQVMKEFWPDIKRKYFSHHQHDVP